MGRKFPLLTSCLGCPLKTGAIISGVYGIVNTFTTSIIIIITTTTIFLSFVHVKHYEVIHISN
ncbi:Uncharacterized protein FWK35_00004568 [Aphis craccivora]|uniref:Uncharacterized protein n=1 Tax=Aphis craccivora TaxID=307492 RepID=A0A6G0ZN23_APHCR|nr:Uncharacterized protein FWK35_00004568 [Aphis craccivora]